MTGLLPLGAADPTARLEGFRDLARDVDARARAEGAPLRPHPGLRADVAHDRTTATPRFPSSSRSSASAGSSSRSPAPRPVRSAGPRDRRRRTAVSISCSRCASAASSRSGTIERRRAGRAIETYELYRVADPYAPGARSALPERRGRPRAELPAVTGATQSAPARGSARWPKRARRFARAGARTEPSRLFETGGLRWRFPRSTTPARRCSSTPAAASRAAIRYRVALALEDGAAVEATTTAAEKIYRSDGPPARIATALTLDRGARLLWLPQETILFDGARLDRTLDDRHGRRRRSPRRRDAGVRPPRDGRDARSTRALRDSWRMRRAGRLVFADETRLDRAGATPRPPGLGAGARAVATILAAAPDVEARLPDLRAALDAQREGVEAGASAFDGLLVARLVSRLAEPIARSRDRGHCGAERTPAAAPVALRRGIAGRAGGRPRERPARTRPTRDGGSDEGADEF